MKMVDYFIFELNESSTVKRINIFGGFSPQNMCWNLSILEPIFFENWWNIFQFKLSFLLVIFFLSDSWKDIFNFHEIRLTLSQLIFPFSLSLFLNNFYCWVVLLLLRFRILGPALLSINWWFFMMPTDAAFSVCIEEI